MILKKSVIYEDIFYCIGRNKQTLDTFEPLERRQTMEKILKAR